jgi:hypothetical protein
MGLSALTTYYFRAISSVGATQYTANSVFATVPLYESIIPLTNGWKYTAVNQDGQNWTTPGYDDSNWLGPGAALLYVEDSTNVFPKNTPLPGTAGSLPPTYYFRTHFAFTNTSSGFALLFSNYVDDGAVFYLNGTEIYRVRMAAPPTAITNKSLATTNPPSGDAIYAEVFRIAGDLMTNLVVDDNVLAAEVHQDVPNSSDIVFGASVGLVRAQVSETKLWMARSNDVVQVWWDGINFTLQQAHDVGGTNSWNDVSGPVKTSPYIVTNPAPSTFYRLRN